MAVKIRSLGYSELKQVLSLLHRFGGDDFTYDALEHLRTLYLPFHFINKLLPLFLKFLPEIYVALDSTQGNNANVMALVWASQDGKHRDRWKIDQIIRNPDTTLQVNVEQQLVLYTINRLGGQGVETFLAYVDPYFTEGSDLLKSCGFRHATKLHRFTLDLSKCDNGVIQSVDIEGIRDAQDGDRTDLVDLASETLTPELRGCLKPSADDLHQRWWSSQIHQFTRGCYRRWVVPLPRGLYATGALSTDDYKQFEVSLAVSPAWEEHTEDMLRFLMAKAAKTTTSAVLHVQAYDFQRHLLETLEQVGFTRVNTTEILVKDYWSLIEDRSFLSQNPILLFNNQGRTSPANYLPHR